VRCGVCDEPLGVAGVSGRYGGPGRCGRCALAAPPFRTLRGAAPYRGIAREILIAFKFGGADFLGPRLAAVMAERLALPADVDEVAAVPASVRARWKNDHGAELLAASIAARVRLPFEARRLRKVRATARQSGLPLSERPGNVRGAFRASPAPARRVLLVDDVATSGATARECARALRRAGAKSVDVWCFARASRDDLLLR
jgi:predicted amidophosphoribosyltransferase